MKNILNSPNKSICGNVKEVAARTCIIMALKRKCYGYWRDKKAGLEEQSIYKETLSNGNLAVDMRKLSSVIPQSSKMKKRIDISEYNDIIIDMEPIEVFKALSNESRLKILQWLKEPDRHFAPHEGIDMNTIGVCVSQITDKLKMTQSTASQYLTILLRAGLIKAERIGKYTYYKRDEEAIGKLADFLKTEI